MLVTVPAKTLQPGNYVLNVETKHDNQKSTTKLSKELGVVEATERIVTQEVPTPFIPIWGYAVLGGLFLWYLLTLVYFKSKKFRKFLKNF
jgi:hypothetical protein